MTAITGRPTVKVDEPTPGVVLLTLNRPERLNAMSHELVADLHLVLEAVGTDRSCRVVVLTGAGRGFCAGLDLKGAGEAPGTNGLGKIQSGALELSNVDLASEFTNLITTQRAYQANARIITTSDEMLQELVNLKR